MFQRYWWCKDTYTSCRIGAPQDQGWRPLLYHVPLLKTKGMVLVIVSKELLLFQVPLIKNSIKTRTIPCINQRQREFKKMQFLELFNNNLNTTEQDRSCENSAGIAGDLFLIKPLSKQFISYCSAVSPSTRNHLCCNNERNFRPTSTIWNKHIFL